MKNLIKIILSLLLYISVQGQTYFNKTYDFYNVQNYGVKHLILPDSSIFLPITYNDQFGNGILGFLFIDQSGDTLFWSNGHFGG